MSQENNFIPDQENYKPLSPFRLFVKSNFPFIENTYEALDNYGLYCKVVEYLNTVIENENTVESNVGALYDAFVSLNNYVSDYFDNLDLQEEVNIKLDELVTDGTLSRIINNDLLGNINNKILQNTENIGTLGQQVQNSVKISDTNVVSMSMLSQEVRAALTGGSTPVVGVNSVNIDNIADKAITSYKLDEFLSQNFTKEFINKELTGKVEGNAKRVVDNVIENVVSSGYRYYDISLENGKYYSIKSFNTFVLPGYIIYDSSDNSVIDVPTITDTSKRFESIYKLFRCNKSGIRVYINSWNAVAANSPMQVIDGITISELSKVSQNENPNGINLLKTIEGYSLLATASNVQGLENVVNMGANQYANTKIYKLSKGTKYSIKGSNIYSIAGLVVTNENYEFSYKSSTGAVGSVPVPFTYEFTATNDGYAFCVDFSFNTISFTTDISIVKNTTKYSTLKWSLIGDSLTDENVNTDVKKYYSYIQDDIGINIQNLGQSGCGYKRKYNNGNNFYEQSSLVSSDTDVVTIFGSFNDMNESIGTPDDTTTDTVLGSVYATINNLITNKQNVKIGIILPTPWGNNGDYPSSISANVNAYIEGIKTIAKKFSVPVLDLFYGSNMFPWKDNFKTSYFVNSDGVHPNSAGNKRFAYKIEEFLKTLI